MLNARRKWTEERKDLTVGEVVLCLEHGLPRGKWPLVRTEKIHSEPDGHVRVAHVRIEGNVYVRPVTKLLYVHWNLTQMQTTDVDDDLPRRGILTEM